MLRLEIFQEISHLTQQLFDKMDEQREDDWLEIY